jgi:hypothetical protein
MRMLAKGLLASAILALAVAAPVSAATHNIQKDFEVTGRVTATFRSSRLPAELHLAVSGGSPFEALVNRYTAIVVEAGASLRRGARAEVWFHLNGQGRAVADLVAVWAVTVQCGPGATAGGPPTGGGQGNGGGIGYGGGPPSGSNGNGPGIGYGGGPSSGGPGGVGPSPSGGACPN